MWKQCLCATILVLVAVNGQLTPAQHAFLRKGASKRIQNDLDFLPRLVQISFHDCKGGCDGCVDVHGNHGNKGLDSTLDMILKFRNDFAPQLSRADVIAFLGIESLRLGAQFANGTVNVPYSIGRQDCDLSNGFPHRDLPHGTVLNTVELLSGDFALTDREAVALMGCHSLGGAHTDRSGFQGDWDSHPHQLDNGFFLNLASGDWVPKAFNNANVNSTAWTRPNSNFIMLHADMAMLKRFTVGDPHETASCSTMSECEDASSSQIIFDFARNQGSFHTELSSAFKKMLDGDGTGLQFVA
ncbi:putative ascorbate peroxidase [Watersipora subatra]|uniref:putative ascorbate peroxidase n=1 Tax=Watersipora subatra TaxID=2589382 RepID=UPI00355C7E97